MFCSGRRRGPSVSSSHTAGGIPPEILNPRKFLMVLKFEHRSGTSCQWLGWLVPMCMYQWLFFLRRL